MFLFCNQCTSDIIYSSDYSLVVKDTDLNFMNLLFVKELCYFYFLITQVVSEVLVIDLLIQAKTARYQEYSPFSGLEGMVY